MVSYTMLFRDPAAPITPSVAVAGLRNLVLVVCKAGARCRKTPAQEPAIVCSTPDLDTSLLCESIHPLSLPPHKHFRHSLYIYYIWNQFHRGWNLCFTKPLLWFQSTVPGRVLLICLQREELVRELIFLINILQLWGDVRNIVGWGVLLDISSLKLQV